MRGDLIAGIAQGVWWVAGGALLLVLGDKAASVAAFRRPAGKAGYGRSLVGTNFIGQLLAAIATIATLVNLGVEVRQNTRAVRSSTFQENRGSNELNDRSNLNTS